jgi:leucyl-tRNA synthetase
VVHTVEPFQKLVNQGMILGYSYRYFDDDVRDESRSDVRRYGIRDVEQDGERVLAREDGRELKARNVRPSEVRKGPDGVARHPTSGDLELEEVVEKMSKSRGNVINPDEVVADFGADSMRLYELFLGPIEKDAPWSTEGIQGVRRFLDRSWRLVLGEDETGSELVPGPGSEEQQRLTARTIAGVTEDLEAMRFNTAISKLMVFTRDLGRDAPVPTGAARVLVRLLAPLAPHIAEELWARLGGSESLAYAPWPEADASVLQVARVTLVLQVNGKRRGEIEVEADADEASVRAAALASEAVQRHLAGREPRKVIVVRGRLVNVVG